MLPLVAVWSVVGVAAHFLGASAATIKIVAIRVSDGSLVWEQSISTPEGRTVLERMVDVDGAMSIIGSDLYAVGYRGRVAALTADAGRILWVREASSFSGLTASREQLNLTDRLNKLEEPKQVLKLLSKSLTVKQ